MPHVVDGTESAVALIWAGALAPGSFRWRGTCAGQLVNEAGEIIGGFSRYVSGRGWSISTRPYGGFAHPEEVIIKCICAGRRPTDDHWHDATAPSRP